MSSKPLTFCAHLARAVRAGRKTTTWKPLSPGDMERRRGGGAANVQPYKSGDVVPVLEPYGFVHGEPTYYSSFVSDEYGVRAEFPPGFIPAPGTRAERHARIVGCELRELATITEDDARSAGMVPVNGRTHLEEFERQWRDAYAGGQSWEAQPLCWRIEFELVTP